MKEKKKEDELLSALLDACLTAHNYIKPLAVALKSRSAELLCERLEKAISMAESFWNNKQIK